MNEITKILEQKERVIYDGKPEYAPYILHAVFRDFVGVVIISFFIGYFSKSY